MTTEVSAPPTSHQTVRLKLGRHSTPDRGACVVELASMLAGERFSDHPRSVCPVVASYMRALNDCLDDERRQELYPYAAAIVDTRGSRRLCVRRGRLCRSWLQGLGGPSSRLGRLFGRWMSGREAGLVCAKAALREGGLPLALALADTLIAEGRVSEAQGEETAAPAVGQAA